MQKIQVGEIMKKFRIQKNITGKQLCAGLCDESILFKYEKGQMMLDTLLLNRFLERMGVESFSIMLSEQEYDYFCWKEKTLLALEQKEWNQLENLLEKNSVLFGTDSTKKLQMQYYFYLKGIAASFKYKNRNTAFEYFDLAVKQTIPDIVCIDRKNGLLGELELHIAILYLYYGKLTHILKNERAETIFEKLERYLSDDNIKKKLQAKFYPKLICVWIKTSEKKVTERDVFCKKAIHLLKETKTLYDIIEILKNYIVVLEERNSEFLLFYKKYLEIFIEIFEQEHIEIAFFPEIIISSEKKVFLISEYFFSKRMEKNITQQTLSEGICAVETYSRIETGKRIPSAKNLHALTEKLEIGWCSYRGELETDNLQAYELRQKQRTAAIEGRFEDEFCILQKMERVLDMQSAINYQYVKAKQVKVQERLGQIKAEEAYEKDMELLQKTTTLCLEERLVYYSQTEAEIIGHMAQMLRKQKKVEEGIALLERVLGNIRKNKVKIEHQWSGTEFLLRVLGGLYFEIGRYEDSNRIKRYCYKMSLRFRDGGNIPELLDAIADNFEHLGEQYRSEYEKLYRYAYYTADFFEIIDAKVFLKTYYEEHFDATMQWY